jgi:hypothetical protein
VTLGVGVGVGLGLGLGEGVGQGEGVVLGGGEVVTDREGLGLGVLDRAGRVGEWVRGGTFSRDGGSSDGDTDGTVTTRGAWRVRCAGNAEGNRGAGLAPAAVAMAAGSPRTVSPVAICQPATPITPSAATAPVAAAAAPILCRRPAPRR